jgi:hypothetical protein
MNFFFYWISFSERIWIFVWITPWVESVIVITNYFMSIGFWCHIAIVFNCYNSVNFINKCLISPIVGLVWSVDYQLLNIPTSSPWSWAWIIMIFLFLGTFKKLSYQSGLGFWVQWFLSGICISSYHTDREYKKSQTSIISPRLIHLSSGSTTRPIKNSIF